MCGIVGYIGPRDVPSVLLVGLERLSYRGYDSSGISILTDGELSNWRKEGKLHKLEEKIKNLSISGQLGIGHTRWATHGQPNETNAHPHLSQNNRISIVHNGIIENFLSLKNRLIKQGFIFRSETDSEVIAHLIQFYLNGNLVTAVEKACLELVGSFAIAVISESDPNKIIVARKGSPLIIGLGDNENYVSSDINAIITHTKDVIYLDDNQVGIIQSNEVKIKEMGGQPITPVIETISWDASDTDKAGYPHYMLKEIYEQPTVVRTILSKILSDTNSFIFDHLRMQNQDLAKASRFIIQACGTSWHAGLFGKYLFEKYTRIPTEVDISSEFRYRQIINGGNEIVMAISQSGETADTLACLREAKSKFFKVLSLVNVKGSTIDRESDGIIYTHAGTEVGVASTKNFLAQLINIYLFTAFLGQLKWTLDDTQIKSMITELKLLPDYLDRILGQSQIIESIADKYYQSKQFLFIGRGVNYPSALEGALKLKEISYIHATGYAAGELKHGPIALIDDQLPVVCICPKSDTYEKMVSNIQEVKARKGKTIVIATEGDSDIEKYSDDIIYVPEISEELTPILVAIPMQLLAYHIALKLNCDVDQPRNLAKSVTVE